MNAIYSPDNKTYSTNKFKNVKKIIVKSDISKKETQIVFQDKDSNKFQSNLIPLTLRIQSGELI